MGIKDIWDKDTETTVTEVRDTEIMHTEVRVTEIMDIATVVTEIRVKGITDITMATEDGENEVTIRMTNSVY